MSEYDLRKALEELRDEHPETLTPQLRHAIDNLPPLYEAKPIAALITDAAFFRSYYTLFNHEPILLYTGTGLTELARRRG